MDIHLQLPWVEWRGMKTLGKVLAKAMVLGQRCYHPAGDLSGPAMSPTHVPMDFSTTTC